MLGGGERREEREKSGLFCYPSGSNTKNKKI
jgi:hypothetical protein